MERIELRVDGNAMAGAFREFFVQEMTWARIACSGCGKIEEIGAEHAYLQAPGMVLRCCHCEAVLLVISKRSGRSLIGFRDVEWLEIEPRG